jgi:hypothetical protein
MRKQLANKTNQNIVRILAIDVVRNRIAYQEYEVIQYYENSQRTFEVNGTIWLDIDKNNLNILDKILQGTDITEDLYAELQSIFPDYVIENEGQNWIYPDEEPSRDYRIIIHVKRAAFEAKNNPIFKQLYDYLQNEHKDFIVWNSYEEDYAIMYVKELKQSEIDMLPEGAINSWIFIETKI